MAGQRVAHWTTEFQVPSEGRRQTCFDVPSGRSKGFISDRCQAMLLTKSFPIREHEISAHLANQSRTRVPNDFFLRVKQLNWYNLSESMICLVIVRAKQLSYLTKKCDSFGFILRKLSRMGGVLFVC